MRNREDAIKEKQQFYENEIENNKEQEKKISLAERTAARLRLDCQEAEQQRDQFQSEVKMFLFSQITAFFFNLSSIIINFVIKFE